jgi:hypothetical protein
MDKFTQWNTFEYTVCPEMYMLKGSQNLQEELLGLSFRCVIYINQLYEVLFIFENNF